MQAAHKAGKLGAASPADVLQAQSLDPVYRLASFLETRVDRSLPRGLSLRSIVEGAEVPR